MLLEPSGDKGVLPLVKDKFANERKSAKVACSLLRRSELRPRTRCGPLRGLTALRRAKRRVLTRSGGRCQIVNFSIAYGKTKKGLAVDLSVTPEEAQETINKCVSRARAHTHMQLSDTALPLSVSVSASLCLATASLMSESLLRLLS